MRWIHFYRKVTDLDLQIYFKRNSSQIFSLVFVKYFKNSFFEKHVWASKYKSWKKLNRQKQPPLFYRCSVKKDFLKNFANFKGKHLCWSLFLIKLQASRPATLLKRDSNTGVFLLSLRDF